MTIKILVGTVLCLSLTGLIFRLVSIVRLGRVFGRNRGTLAARIVALDPGRALANTMFQTRLFSAGKWRWAAHFLVVSGFVYLVFVHALDDWTGTLFGWYQPGIDPFRLMRNIAGLMVAAGCGAFLIRRIRGSRINRERLSRGLRFRVRGTVSILVILGLICSGFLAEGLNIMSENRFDEMVDEYSDLAGEPELIHLKAYWERYYDVSFAGGIQVQPGPESGMKRIDFSEGAALNEAYCLDCHTRPQTAFVSSLLARQAAPLGPWLAAFRLERIFYWIHFGFAMTLILFFPFSRMFHLAAIPLASMGRRMTPADLSPDMGWLDLAALSACTGCGFCSQVCSVYPDYQTSENPQVLPHMKIETLKRLAGKGVWDFHVLTRLRSGNDDCTRCGLCADICPSSIDLVRLWTSADRVMDRLGCPGPYATAMSASFSQWAPGQPEARRGAGPDDGPLSGLINDADAFEHCVQCTLCTNACPVVAHDPAGNDLGPHQIMNLLRLGEARMASGSKMVWHCLTCYACQEICPQAIRVTDILLELRCRGQARAESLSLARLRGREQ